LEETLFSDEEAMSRAELIWLICGPTVSAEAVPLAPLASESEYSELPARKSAGNTY
jgi:hypothetical protein